jgi:hypothetical protein
MNLAECWIVICIAAAFGVVWCVRWWLNLIAPLNFRRGRCHMCGMSQHE